MFSGIIEELGELKEISRRGNVTLLEIHAPVISPDTKIGESISVNGACLTVVKKEQSDLSFEAMPQTLKATNLGSLKIKDKVNLERALKIGERLSGHFVTGHVDCIGIIRQKKYIDANLCFEIAVPIEFIAYILPKGSIAVDGISLTIMDKRSNTFRVYIIPHTLKNTTLGFKGPSDKVNVEFDILAKVGTVPAES
ncbi:MAG: riboflavin synthase [Candidatus Omnitrophica bacterium]|nr:riboflavin synthase [Candidatus Omnitrophota bacterium]MDD5592326.1 riboflavin synthase [Candidatus Omnitrophota bacterium]